MTVDASSAYERFMRRCLELARRALADGEASVGALVVMNGQVIGEGIEGVKRCRDVTAHAEIEALRAACSRLGSVDLSGCQMVTTVAPCVMCAYAIRLARVSVVVTGTESSDSERPLNGRVVLTNPDVLPNRPVPELIAGVLESECRALLSLRNA